MATLEDELVRLICAYSSVAHPEPPPLLPSALDSIVARRLPRRVRAVLLDIYGTLVVSATGDVGTAAESSVAESFQRAVELAAGTAVSELEAERLREAFFAEIERRHVVSRAKGLPAPEVDIIEVWRAIHSGLAAAGVSLPIDLQRLAVSYEVISNPVWPMPGVRGLLDGLARLGMRVGVVSNAQFYTRLLFPALLGDSLDGLGITADYSAFSFETGRAKPDPKLFDAPLAALASAGIDSGEVVYLGNDMLNDVYTASRRGCMTALFAGDSQSLRLRQEDSRVSGLVPDTVVRTLHELLSVLENEDV